MKLIIYIFVAKIEKKSIEESLLLNFSDISFLLQFLELHVHWVTCAFLTELCSTSSGYKTLTPLHEKCSYSKFFLVWIFPHLDWIQMRENAAKKNSEYGHFYAVLHLNFVCCFSSIKLRHHKKSQKKYMSYTEAYSEPCQKPKM